jgi:Domain of unknown function (DUF4405)
MLRQCASIALLVSIIALGSSGLLMIFLNSFTFQIQMHPVHKIFGIIMCVSGCLHIYLNFRPIKTYLNNRKLLITGTLLSIFMIFLFVVGLNKPFDHEVVKSIEKAMSQIESRQ